jgi:nesprin-1
VKDVEKELTAETNSFHRNEDVGGIMKQHTQFFTTSGLKLKIEECLKNLSRLSKTFTEKMPENLVLQESYAKHQEHWDSLMARIQSLAAQLQQIPEQWKTYEAKFSSMVTWMDSIDASLAKMFKGISSDKDFEVEKKNFQEICEAVEERKEDMKWLVQQLDHLVAHRADNEGLSEQKRLEGLITRYKSMIPVIEATMVKLDIYSRSYAFRAQVNQFVGVLDRIHTAVKQEAFPDSHEAVDSLIKSQESMIEELEKNRSSILTLLQRGKELSKEPNAPDFLKEDVKTLDTKWNESYGCAREKLKRLRETQKIWLSYKEQKAVMVKLLDDAEKELRKLVPKHDHKKVQSDLKINKEMRDDIKRVTDDLMGKMRELSETLASVASQEQQDAFSKEMSELEARLNELLTQCDDRIKHLGILTSNGLTLIRI